MHRTEEFIFPVSRSSKRLAIGSVILPRESNSLSASYSYYRIRMAYYRYWYIGIDQVSYVFMKNSTQGIYDNLAPDKGEKGFKREAVMTQERTLMNY